MRLKRKIFTRTFRNKSNTGILTVSGAIGGGIIGGAMSKKSAVPALIGASIGAGLGFLADLGLKSRIRSVIKAEDAMPIEFSKFDNLFYDNPKLDRLFERAHEDDIVEFMNSEITKFAPISSSELIKIHKASLKKPNANYTLIRLLDCPGAIGNYVYNFETLTLSLDPIGRENPNDLVPVDNFKTSVLNQLDKVLRYYQTVKRVYKGGLVERYILEMINVTKSAL